VKVLVVSDTHKSIALAEKALRPHLPADLLIHLGDYVEDGAELSSRLGIAFKAVRGDNDFCAGDSELELELDGLRVFLSHGHGFGIDDGLGRFFEECRRRGSRLGFFGHSHRAQVSERDGIFLVNPGNLYMAEKANSLAMVRTEPGRARLELFDTNGGGVIDVREI